jgi:hypothetical protein
VQFGGIFAETREKREIRRENAQIRRRISAAGFFRQISAVLKVAKPPLLTALDIAEVSGLTSCLLTSCQQPPTPALPGRSCPARNED